MFRRPKIKIETRRKYTSQWHNRIKIIYINWLFKFYLIMLIHLQPFFTLCFFVGNFLAERWFKKKDCQQFLSFNYLGFYVCGTNVLTISWQKCIKHHRNYINYKKSIGLRPDGTFNGRRVFFFVSKLL